MNQNNEAFTPEEQIKNEIELMKLKLEIESNAMIETSKGSIPHEIELAWFKHIYDYERLCKEAGYSTVYEAIGKPSYQKILDIPPGQVEFALNQLLTHMDNHGVSLEYMENEYSPECIYKFITEELFEEQMCLYKGPEGNGFTMFCYEEFHPNHPYDLEMASKEWLKSMFEETEWVPKWLDHYYEDNIILNQRHLTLVEYSDLVVEFKKKYPFFLFTEKNIHHIELDMRTRKAFVKGSVSMNQENISFTLHLQFDFIWLISAVEMNLL